jgi:hypothetical protein
MTPEDVWRRKSDEELIAASLRLDDYTDEGRRVILSEVEHRRNAGVLVDTTGLVATGDVDASGASDDTPAKDGNFVRRLWRGHVPLWKTYWLGGVFFSLLLMLTISMAEAAGMVIVAGFLALGALVYAVFISVAIWRSAGRYDGPSLWAHLARVAIAFGILRAVAEALLG